MTILKEINLDGANIRVIGNKDFETVTLTVVGNEIQKNPRAEPIAWTINMPRITFFDLQCAFQKLEEAHTKAEEDKIAGVNRPILTDGI